MKEMERYILANVGTFCQQLGTVDERFLGGMEDRKGWSSPKKMSDWCNYLAMDILGDLCFGKAFRMLEGEENRYALDLVAAATKRHLIVSLSLLEHFVFHLPFGLGSLTAIKCGTMPLVDQLKIDRILFPGIAAGRAKYMAYSKAQLMERTKLGDDTDRRDFFYHLLKARDPHTGQGFTTPELWGESNLLQVLLRPGLFEMDKVADQGTSIIAGSDTTSTAMAATFFYLVRNPAALTRATKEIRDKFAKVDEIRQGPDLNSCTYLRACIDEAMRMSPSVGGLLPREVLQGGMAIMGEFVPEGTVVGTPHYAIHHNPLYYPEPFRYVPERWLVGEENVLTGKETTEDEAGAAQSAFCPFSIGPRGCIGKGLAYSEMMTALSRVLFIYDIRRALGVVDPGEGSPELEWGRHRKEEFQLVDTFTSMKNGPMVEFRKVNHV